MDLPIAGQLDRLIDGKHDLVPRQLEAHHEATNEITIATAAHSKLK
jgi:hypothetical protein